MQLREDDNPIQQSPTSTKQKACTTSTERSARKRSLDKEKIDNLESRNAEFKHENAELKQALIDIVLFANQNDLTELANRSLKVLQGCNHSL